MKQFAKRGLALFAAFVLVISMMPAIHHHTAHAAGAEVEYVYSGDYIYNWGTRGTLATFLSPNAEAFYTGDYTYDALSALAGGTSADTAPGSALYAALQELMVSRQTYETTYDATKTLFQYTDCENSAKTSNKISSFYSGTAIGPDWDGAWNREHTWPNSKGDDSGNGENDIMMLRPTSTTENSGRGNKAYGTTTTDEFYNPNEISGGQYDLRGDVSRIALYVYVRWGNTGYMWGSSGVIESLEVLLAWMEADPVDTWEMGRNDSVESITGTRNVFVDYPELAFLLFGAEVPSTMSTPSGSTSDHSHNYTSEVTTAATCTTDGVRTYTCTTCGSSYTEVIAATGHNYENGVCTGCGEAEPTGYTATLVTSTAQLSSGDQIVIVAQDYAYALSTAQNDNNRGQAEITKSADGATVTFMDGSGVQIITLEAGTTAGTFAFNVGDGYLYAASTGKNWLRTETTLSDNSSWLITITDGVFSVIAQGTNTRNVLQYNQSSSIFACYGGSTQKAITIYVIDNDNDDGGEDDECTHSYTPAVTTEATCTADGLRTYTCSLCGDSYTEVIPALGHNYVEGICTGCGEAEPSEHVATLVTDAAQLRVGDQIIIVAQDYNYALSTTQNGNNRGQAEITKNSDGTITFVDGSGVQIITLEAGTKDGTFAFNVGDGYLYAASTSKNYLRTETTLSDNSSWLIAISGDATTVTAQGTNTKNLMQYNNSNGLFACYSSAQKAIVIYVIDSGESEPDPTPECEHANTTVEGAADATCTEAGHTGKTVCSDCGETVNAGSVIPALGHDYVEGVCSRCGAEDPVTEPDPDATEATIDLTTTDNRTVYNTEQQVWQQNGIIVTNDKAASTTNVADYAPARFYKNSSLTVEYPGMVRIVFNCNDNKDTYAADLVTSIGTVDGMTVAVDGRTVTVTFAAAKDSFVIEALAAQIRMDSITVYTVIDGEFCEHTSTTVEGAADATCTEAGHTGKTVCSDCGETVNAGSVIPALGHDYVEGVCSRCGAEESFYVVIDAPVAGTAYKFGMVQQNVSSADVYYLTGAMSGYYMDTTTNKDLAADVYLEETTGGYYLYTLIDGTKTYINMVVSGTYVNGAYETAPSTVYTFDETNKTIVADIDGTAYWFGTRNDDTYTTVGPCKVSYNGFYCQFYGETAEDVVLNGIHQDEDGTWRYYVNGEVADYTGLVEHTDGKLYYVYRGVVPMNYVGLYAHSDGKVYFVYYGTVPTDYDGLYAHTTGTVYYIDNGVVSTTYTGLYAHSDGKNYYVYNGVIPTSYIGLCYHTDGKAYYIYNGVAVSSYTGLYNHTDGKVYYINNGVIDPAFVGLYTHTTGATYYVYNGVVLTSYVGLYLHTDGKAYYVYNGMLVPNYMGFYLHSDGKLYYISSGVIAVNYTGLAQHTNGLLYYVVNGVFDATYNGTATFNDTEYEVVNGIAQP